MKQFIYSASVLGLNEWPSGTLRLDGIEQTEDPRKADVFVCPGAIRMFEASHGVLDVDRLNRLPYFKGNEARHAFFDVSDNFTKPINLPILFIRCDVRSWMLPSDTGTIQVAWPVENYSECIELPDGGFKYDVAFHGWNWSDTRQKATKSCLSKAGLKCDFALFTDFFGYCKPTDPQYGKRRSEFRRSMRESRLSLCPESIPGVFPYRFFEAMSAARVPVLVCRDFVYPFADEIPYHDFIYVCEPGGDVGSFVKNIVDTTADEELVSKGKLARLWWEKLLDSRRWPEIMAYAVRKKLGE